MNRVFFVLGSLSGGLAMALGALGAHVLKARLSPDMLANFETGVRYQMPTPWRCRLLPGRPTTGLPRSCRSLLAGSLSRGPCSSQ